MLSPLRPRRALSAAAALALTTALTAPAAGDSTPLETAATRHVNFETAHVLPQGTVSLQAGAHQTPRGTGGGTGSQVYYGGVDWVPRPNLQLGFSAQIHEDPPYEPIAGQQPPLRFSTLAGSLKYQVYDDGRLAVAAQGSLELFEFSTGLFRTGANGTNADNLIGSVHLPVSYEVNPTLRFTLTPGVSVFPEDLNGFGYYGTVASLGAGVTLQPSARFQAFATVNVPLSGGNTITSTRAISREPVLTAGARYAFTPKVALEAYVTNGIGVTPATGILTFFPNGDEPLFGLKIHYTPDAGRGYPDSYKTNTLRPLSARDAQLSRDGFTLAAGNTLAPGRALISASGGEYDNYAGSVFYSPDQDFQLEGAIERYAADGSVGRLRDPSPGEDRFMVGGRLRVLDQMYGDAASASLRVLAGRDLDPGNRTGVLYVGVPVTYQATDRTAINVNPKAAAFGNETKAGVGFGINHMIYGGLQLIGEVTPVTNGEDPVWAAGLRYDVPRTGLSVDLAATNAIGRYGLGTLIAQDDARISLGVSMPLDLKRR